MVEMKNASFTWQEYENGPEGQRSNLAHVDRQNSEDDSGSENSNHNGCPSPTQDLVGINLKLRKVS